MIGVVAIVRDEAENIGRLLDAAGEGPATIVDTGSQDDTVEILAARGITAYSVPFVNFGQARSEAFRLARGTADFLLALDADMTVEIDPDFEPDPTVDAYMISLGGPDFKYRLPLLLRGDLPWQSTGACHEYTALPDRAYVGVPTDKVRITHHGDGRSSPEKSRWQLSLLETELAEQPDNARTIFYIAQTLWDLDRKGEALAMYERRAKMPGWDEETFYAKYRLALCTPSWPARMQALIRAWEFRPTRLEPVYELIRELNYRGQHNVALQFAHVSNVVPADNLFLHMDQYRWGLDFERSIAEWWVGSRDVFEQLSAKLLAMPDLPEHIRAAVVRNLGFQRAA